MKTNHELPVAVRTIIDPPPTLEDYSGPNNPPHAPPIPPATSHPLPPITAPAPTSARPNLPYNPPPIPDHVRRLYQRTTPLFPPTPAEPRDLTDWEVCIEAHVDRQIGQDMAIFTVECGHLWEEATIEASPNPLQREMMDDWHARRIMQEQEVERRRTARAKEEQEEKRYQRRLETERKREEGVRRREELELQWAEQRVRDEEKAAKERAVIEAGGRKGEAMRARVEKREAKAEVKRRVKQEMVERHQRHRMAYIRRKRDLEMQKKEEKLREADARKAAKAGTPGAGRKRPAGAVVESAAGKKRKM